MAITVGTYPTVESLTADGLRYYRAQLYTRGVTVSSANLATQKGGDRWMTVSGFANSLAVVLANSRALEDAQMPDTATGDDLVRLCAVYGITPSTGAGATGNVTVTCTGTVTYAADQEATSVTTGKRYKVTTVTTVTNGQTVPVQGIDIGPSTDLAAGEVLTWTSPPNGSATTCVVDAGGLTNGVAADTDGTLRRRLLERLQKPQNGGSWAHYRSWAEKASAAVETAYVYPAAQGPGTVHIAYTIAGTRDNNYAREGTTALTTVVANGIAANAPEYADTTVTTVAHQGLAAVFRLTLPNPVSEGGAGGGWINTSPVDSTTKIGDRWPLLTKSDLTTVGMTTPPQIASITSNNVFTVNGVWTLPTAGTTVVQFWDSTNLVLRTAKVVSYTNTAGPPYNVTITLDVSLPTLLVGDYIMPATERGETYAEAFCADIATLSPGEKVTNAALLPRAYRHPKAVDGYPSAVTTLPLAHLQDRHSEITNASYWWVNGLSPTLPLEPDSPASVTDAPNIWRVGDLSFFP